ncbi:MAG TPA: hypothetical protein VLR90_10935 [Blastocatellia bacterium]|nr:hypothetical protein [Blastocatellia bacterium]
MKLEFVPLLKVQRELYGMPRGMERFQAYLATMIDPETRDMKLPLSGMNPMGKDHIPVLLDQYLAMDADQIAALAVADAESRLTNIQGEFKVALVLSDDAMGGWTNRYTSEFGRRFGTKAYHRRGWLEVGLWTSEAPAAETVREQVLATIYRAAHIEQHGFAHTLRDMLAQEGFAMAQAGCIEPALDADDLAYTREVIRPYLDTKDYSTIIACLFGDEAARSLGYAPVGLSARAGFALALNDGRLERRFA